MWLVVYVDNFKLAGPAENLKKGWSLIKEAIDIGEPEASPEWSGASSPLGPAFFDVFSNCLKGVLMLIGFKLFSQARGASYAAQVALHYQQCLRLVVVSFCSSRDREKEEKEKREENEKEKE